MKRIVNYLVFLFAILFINVDVKAISLSEVYENRNNASELSNVTTVEITKDDNLEYVYLLGSLPNLNYIYTAGVSFDDATFINGIHHDFTFAYNGCEECYINLAGINSEYLKTLYLSITEVYNFSNIKNLTNLQDLNLDIIFNGDEIDYDTLHYLTNLKSLRFETVEIYKFQDFFENINALSNLKTLSLKSTNIQNKDIKYLKLNTNITSLDLNTTMVTDISFLRDMINVDSVVLPANVEDFSVLYELNNLENVWWDDYTQYNITDELVEYLNIKGIHHTRHFSEIRNTINELIEEANILDTDDDYTKVLKVMKVMQSFAVIDTSGYNPNEDTGGTALSKIVLLRKGVCNNWSSLADALLNAVGVEAYKVVGFMGMAHAWNLVKLDGKIYAIDIMNARPYPDNYFDISSWVNSTKAFMFRDPLRVDSYREVDAQNNNLNYNYDFPVRFVETDGFEKTRMLYDFELADGILNISMKKIWIDLNTNINSLNIVPIDGYSYKYYDSLGNVKNSGIAETGDYIVVTSSISENYSHRYDIIVEERTYKIKLESDSFGKNESITVKNGGKYEGLFTPIKYCYRFLGWYTAKNGGTLITSDSIVDINKVDTLYAHWEFDNKYVLSVVYGGLYTPGTFIFEPNTPYGQVKNISDDSSKPQLYDTNFAIPSAEKKFSGVYSEAEGGKLITFYSEVIINSDHSIYSHYVDETELLYYVKIDCLYCNGYMYTPSKGWPIEPGSKVSKFYTPTRDGYTFKYWSVNGEEYDFDTPVTSDITIEAEWEVAKYTVSFDSRGGTSISNQIVNYNGYVTRPNNPTKDGYTFKYWSLNGEEYNFNTPVTSDMTLKAVYEYNGGLVLKGDMNTDGDITLSDVIYLLKVYLGVIDPTDMDEVLGDMNDDNNIGLIDIIMLLRVYLGID